MTRATMPGKHNYTEYTPEQLQLICDKLSALEDKAQAKLNDTDKCMQVVDLWNQICKSFSKVSVLSPARKTAVNARLIKYTVEHFEKAFKIFDSYNLCEYFSICSDSESSNNRKSKSKLII